MRSFRRPHENTIGYTQYHWLTKNITSNYSFSLMNNIPSEAAKTYFEGVADGYMEASFRWPWSYLRQHEAKAFFSLCADLSNKRVLDLGCGSGFFSSLALQKGASHVVAVDFSAAMLSNLPHDRVSQVTADISLPLPLNEKFEVIFIAGVLEFLNFPETALTNARIVAQHNANLILLAPCDNWLGGCYQSFHRNHGVTIHRFSTRRLEGLAKATGWIIEQKKTVFPFAHVQQWRKV